MNKIYYMRCHFNSFADIYLKLVFWCKENIKDADSIRYDTQYIAKDLSIIYIVCHFTNIDEESETLFLLRWPEMKLKPDLKIAGFE